MTRPNSKSKKIFEQVMSHAEKFGDQAEFFEVAEFQKTLPSGQKEQVSEETFYDSSQR